MLALAGVPPAVPDGEDAAVALPPSSDCSLGICTLRRGLFAPEVSAASEETD